MSDNLQKEALGQLKTIRRLMERSSLYRAVSGPAALVGGFLSLVAVFFFRNAEPGKEVGGFLLVWLSLLLVSSFFNTFLLKRQSQEEGRFFTPSMLAALKALAPAMLAGGAAGLLLLLGPGGTENLVPVAILWVISYGVALLATGSFAPRSLWVLGLAFLVLGLGLAVWERFGTLPFGETGELSQAHLVMASSFGFLHLLYGAAVILGRKPERDPNK